MKLRLTTSTPRNPWVAPTRMRHAGAHRRTSGALRQRAELATRKAWQSERTPPT